MFGGIIAGTVKSHQTGWDRSQVPMDDLSDEDKEWIKNRKR